MLTSMKDTLLVAAWFVSLAAFVAFCGLVMAVGAGEMTGTPGIGLTVGRFLVRVLGLFVLLLGGLVLKTALSSFSESREDRNPNDTGAVGQRYPGALNLASVCPACGGARSSADTACERCEFVQPGSGWVVQRANVLGAMFGGIFGLGLIVVGERFLARAWSDQRLLIMLLLGSCAVLFILPGLTIAFMSAVSIAKRLSGVEYWSYNDSEDEKPLATATVVRGALSTASGQSTWFVGAAPSVNYSEVEASDEQRAFARMLSLLCRNGVLRIRFRRHTSWTTGAPSRAFWRRTERPPEVEALSTYTPMLFAGNTPAPADLPLAAEALATAARADGVDLRDLWASCQSNEQIAAIRAWSMSRDETPDAIERQILGAMLVARRSSESSLSRYFATRR
jgi:hypothetical protein